MDTNLLNEFDGGMTAYLPLPVSMLQIRTSVHLVPLQRFQFGSAVTSSLLIFDILHVHSFLLVHPTPPRVIVRTPPSPVSQSLSLDAHANIVRLPGNIGNVPR